MDPPTLTVGPVVKFQELYNQCLFKTITVKNLVNELKKRFIRFSDDEGYHVLTLKLRVHILRESEADSSHILPIINELKYLSAGSRTNSYTCDLPGCPFKTKIHTNYLNHIRALHLGSKQKVSCQLKGCKREFQGIIQLENHVKNVHRNRLSTVSMKQKHFVGELTRLKCPS